MTPDDILASAYLLHTKVQSKPLDLRVLGAIIAAGPAGLPLAYVRQRKDLFGTLPAFNPAIERLVAAGWITRTKNNHEVVFVRTSKPVLEIIL